MESTEIVEEVIEEIDTRDMGIYEPAEFSSVEQPDAQPVATAA